MGKQSRRKRQLRGTQEPLHDHVREQAQRLSIGGDLVDDEIVCDFCGASDPRWVYATDETDTTGMGWAACEACYQLIEDESWTGLRQRAVRMQKNRYPVLQQLTDDQLEGEIRPVHDDFRRHRSGRAMTPGQWIKQGRTFSNIGETRRRFGGLFEGGAAADIGAAAPPGESVLHYTPTATGGAAFVPEGFTPEQLADPRTIEYIMARIKADRPVPNVPLTAPLTPVIREWVGARSYLQAMAAIYGECPREDDLAPPLPAMVMAQRILEPVMKAHPVVLEPEQLNAIDDEDWSFAEAIEYAKMAHLPFEPLYLDFGGHTPVVVQLEAGPCRLYGAVIWRSGFFREPTLAVAPIGGFEYLTGPFADMLLAAGLPKDKVIHYAGVRPGHEVRAGQLEPSTTLGQRLATGFYQGRHTARQFEQWCYQPAGICWFGVSSELQRSAPGDYDYPDADGFYLRGLQTVRLRDEERAVAQVLASGRAIGNALGEERLLAGPEPHAMLLSGLDADIEHDPSGQAEDFPGWQRMADGATEMVARLAERALLGLYFIESAPIRVEPVELPRPLRREEERNVKKGRPRRPIASIVVIDRPRTSASRSTGGTRNYTHRWERRGHAVHYHANNRHYQLRPDLVKPCHKCAYEYELNERARRAGQDLPYPSTESPDCIKAWRIPTVCGPEDLPLKKKVRIRRSGPPESEAAA